MSRRSVIKGGLILSLSSTVSALTSFARNIIVARMISVEDFGIAALFALSMSIVEMLSNLGVDRMLVQDRHGDSERMQSTAHAFQVARGFMSATILFFVAPLIADFFGIPQVAWAF